MLLPGCGIIHNRIGYARRYPPTPEGERLLVNCPRYSQKTNYAMLLLGRLIREAGRPLLFRFFAGSPCGRLNGHIAFVKDLKRVLGEDNFAVCPNLGYGRYMNAMEQAALTIDPFPFGAATRWPTRCT